MADERVVAELVAQNAQKFIQDFNNSASAVGRLQQQLEATNRIRTADLAQNVAAVGLSINKLAADGVKDLDEVIKKFNELSQVVTNAGTRVRTPQLRGITQGLAGAIGEVGAARNRQLIESGQLGPVTRLTDATNNLRQSQARAEAQSIALAAAQQKQFSILNTLQQVYQRVTASVSGFSNAINQSSNAQAGANKQGITYLSTLSAIHAASFLATGRTFTLIGSFFTLGAAFSRLGPLAVGVGLAFGGVLAVFNALNTGIQILQQAFITFSATLARVTGIAATAVAAGAAAGVKIAADVEQSLGLIQAIERPTQAALGALEEQITQLSLKFGIAAADVTEAASLFVRAGGGIEQALAGALEAVIQLQIASAGELQAATAARTVAVGLQAFSKEGVTAADVANAVTRAAQGSALSFTEINQAFQQAVPGAVTLGITLNELAAVIAVLGNNALRGTVAGTAFKQFLLDLINPSSDAAKTMAELGINIADADKRVRPLRDILTDLSAVLKDYEASAERGADATKAQAIANIFGSRAALSANIIIRESVEAIDEFNEKTRETTAANVAQVLLLPLNAQFRILINNAREAGRAFGAPLLQPIAQATAAAGKFVADLIPIAKLAGQAIAVIVSDQGFGELKKKIAEVADTRATVFFIELINVGRNVADVIRNQIVPAINDFIATLTGVANEPGRLQQVLVGFNTINKAIQILGAVAADAIRRFGLLVAEFVNGTGEGGKLRDVLDTIATKVLITFVSNTVALAASVAGAILVLDKFIDVALGSARAVLQVIDSVAELNFRLGVLSVRGQIERDIVNERDPEKVEKLRAELFRLDKQIEATPEDARRDQTVRNLIKQIDQFATERGRIRGQMDQLGQDIQNTNTEIIRSFQNVGGSLPDILSNITQAIEQAQAEQKAAGRSGTQGGLGQIVDPKEVERAKERILEAGRDIARRLENLGEDATTKIQNIVTKALERIGDINQKLQRDLVKLERDTADKIKDLEDSIRQRRSDRFRLDIERRQQENRLRVVERSLEKQQLFEERTLEATRIARQRATEDTQRDYDLIADAAERAFTRAQQAAEISFREQQKAQERALEATQSAEEKALQRQLDREATAREEAQQRSEAKTPEERKRVEEQIARARSNRTFEEGQQRQLDALRQRHDRERIQLEARQEAKQRAFQTQQEDAALVERNKREVKAIEFRRDLENQERVVRLQEENALLERRRQNEDFLDNYKRVQAQEFQKFQDQLENEEALRRRQIIKRDAKDRQTDLLDEAERQRGEVLEGVSQQLAEVNQSIDREIRNALQRLEDIEDSLTPDVAAVVRGVLLEVQRAAVLRSQELLQGTALQSEQARAVVGAQLEVTQPTQVPSLIATTLTATNLVLPGGFTQGIANGMFLALAEADRRGFFDTDIPALRELIDILRNPSPLNTRR